MTTSTPVERRRLLARRALLSLSTILAAGFAVPATAQISNGPFPSRYTLDENGVDIPTGVMSRSAVDLSIGSGSHALSLVRRIAYATPRTVQFNFAVSFVQDQSTGDVQVRLPGLTRTFKSNGSGVFHNTDGSGDFYRDGVYTDVSGVTYTANFTSGSVDRNDFIRRVTDIAYPDGYTINVSWSSGVKYEEQSSTYQTYYDRIDWVEDNANHLLRFRYQTDVSNDFEAYQSLTRVDAINTVTETCNESNGYCSSSTPASAQTAAYGFNLDPNGTDGSMTVTGPGGRTKSYFWTTSDFTSVEDGATVKTHSYEADENGHKFDLTAGGVTSTYKYTGATSSTPATALAVDSLSAATRTYSIANGHVTSVAQGDLTSSYDYDDYGRLRKTINADGNSVEYILDARGNVDVTTLRPKDDPLHPIVLGSAEYPSDCIYVASCNSPSSTTDTAGNKTNYTYNALTGQIVAIQPPAPDQQTGRPRTYFDYSLRHGVSLLTCISQDRTATDCISSTKSKTTYSYDENLQLHNVVSGDASVSATTAYAYDSMGDRTDVDGPLAGDADTTHYRYDGRRRLVGVISPDPDDGGDLKRRAQRMTYDDSDNLTLLEQGTVDGITDADWNAFSSLQQQSGSYDTNGRATRQSVSAGGQVYQVTDFSYGDNGLLKCAALRMDSTKWDTKTDACALQTPASDNPDRITYTQYDDLGRASKSTSGFLTAAASDDVTTSYTSAGRIATVSDAKGNVTAYAYDEYGRPWRTCYQTTTAAACAGTPTDYEALGYDVNGNVDDHRLRDGTSIAFTYDALNRLKTKHLPGNEPDATYTYDELGRLKTVDQAGQTLSFTYDALGRVLDQTSALGTVSSLYDGAGPRKQLTWPDSGFFVTYDYLRTGEMKTIREKGATTGPGVLASFDYDNLGNRIKLTRGNGTSTSYTLDPVSRLGTLAQNLASAADSVSAKFMYNPASQIASSTRSNDAYAWPGAVNRSTGYTLNGLNQATAAGSATIGYDARGNTTAIGSAAYTYSAENRLLTGPSSASLTYDPLGRLYQTSGSTTTRLLYDGSDLIGEYNAANALQRRYVFGPGSDEPLVWYEGSGTTDKRWLHADERGSVIAVTNAAGAKIATNAYDEYGVPATTNSGRFGYTGQTWLPELGLSYYKARMYAPTLGRFMQTDPIGYGDGINWYGYVRGDSVNATDPSGLLLVDDIIVIGRSGGGGGGFFSGGLGSIPGVAVSSPSLGGRPDKEDEDIVVTGRVIKKGKTTTLAAIAVPQRADPNPCASAGSAPPPSVYASRGQTVANMANSYDPYGMAPAGAAILDASNLAQFRRGGALDAQVRYGGSPAYANYTFGVYSAASGQSLSSTLSLANTYGYYRSTYRSTVTMDPSYHSIPASNVANITKGYRDQKNNTICHK